MVAGLDIGFLGGLSLATCEGRAGVAGCNGEEVVVEIGRASGGGGCGGEAAFGVGGREMGALAGDWKTILVAGLGERGV